MTDDQYHAFCADVDALIEKHQAYLPGDGGLENLLNGLAEVLRRDAAQQANDLVKSCLDGAAEMCEAAAMNYYVSFK